MILLLAAFAAEPGDTVHGEVLAGLGGCAACHTSDDGPPFAGGHAVVSKYGTFYGSNLTSDPEHGLGRWTSQDFTRAMRAGRSPEGHTYWPAFPYTSFTGLTDGDLADLWAFLRTVPAQPTPDLQHDDPAGWKRGIWRTLAFHPRGPDPSRDRGEYLVEVVGHCGECHSPRNGLGRVRRGEALAGSEAPWTDAPPIDRAALADWSVSDLDTFLQTAMLPDGDFPGGGMTRVVQDGTSRLSAEDRAAMVAFLLGPRED